METDQNKPAQAALAVLAAMALFGLIDNYIRPAAETGGLWQFHMLRSLIALSILFVLATAAGIRLRPLRWQNVLGRSVLNSIAMVIYFGCLGFMPIAQAVAGLFTAPIFVVLISALVYGESVGPRRIFAVVIGFVGIVLVLRPDTQGIGLRTVFPVLAGAIYAMGNITTRRWCAGEGTLTLLAGFFGCMFVWGTIGVTWLTVFPANVPAGADGFLLRGWVWPQGVFLIVVLTQGIGSLIGVGLSIRAYQLADATFVAVFENTLLLFATLWAFVLFGEFPDTIGLAGLALIAAAGVIIAIRSRQPQTVRMALPE